MNNATNQPARGPGHVAITNGAPADAATEAFDAAGLRLSSYGAASRRPSPVNRMMAAFAEDFRDGVDINLGVGYVNEATIPRAELAAAMQAVVAAPERHRQAFNYGGPAGSRGLIAALRGFLAGRGSLRPDALAQSRIVIGPSGATSILDALGELFAPGVVVTGDPIYYIYCDTLERKGFEVLAAPEDAEGPTVEGLRKLMGPKALLRPGPAGERLAFFYFVTVNNPTCTVMSNRRRAELVAFAGEVSRALGRPIPVFFDLAYELLIHDPQAERPRSALNENADGLVYELGTLSKVLAPALRVGYLMGADGPLMDALVQRCSDVGFSAPLMNQELAAHMLEHGMAAQIERVNAGYREKAQAVRQAIDRELGPHLEDVRGGAAGFYYYLTFKTVETHTASRFFRHLARTTGDAAIDGPAGARRPRVIYIPGEYCVHPRGELYLAGRRQLRLSYGFEETARIVEAIGLLREAAES